MDEFGNPTPQERARTELELFNAAWDRLAEQGKADARGSAGYFRVFVAWSNGGRPTDGLEQHLETLANIASDGRGKEQLN